jgi:hypothetical protein
MHLQSILRIVRESGPSMAGGGGTRGISVMALCALARAAAMFVRWYGSGLADGDLEMLRERLRCIDVRWTIGSTYIPMYGGSLACGGLKKNRNVSSGSRQGRPVDKKQRMDFTQLVHRSICTAKSVNRDAEDVRWWAD